MKKLIFLHIPKCGGSTIRDKIIQRYSAAGRVFKLYNDNPRQDYYTPRTLTKFLAENEELPKTVKSIIGHISFEELSLLIDMKGWEIFSVVRDPIDRAISNLNYMRINQNHRGNSHAMKVTENSLYSYLCSLDGALQSKFLGGG
ncbi:sulfotransferase family 2 domain-containing protein [Sessilibacter corallicola]|uniref:Sulfotransferase family protein n=1 Tax=Sessilibacter corallicola TaxID=2904075 RepID=A0ABQ0A826_9GAMM